MGITTRHPVFTLRTTLLCWGGVLGVVLAMPVSASALLNQQAWPGSLGNPNQAESAVLDDSVANPATAEPLTSLLGDELWLGFGLSTPRPSYQVQQPIFRAGADGDDTSLALTSLRPNLAWRVNEQWSLGAGLDIQRGEVRHYPSSSSAPDGEGRSAAESWQTGFNIGMSVALSGRTQLGWHYHSAIKHRFKDNATIDRNAEWGMEGTYLQGSTELTLPAVASLEFSHQADPRWTLLGQYRWFESSRMNEQYSGLDEAGNPVSGGGYRNSWALSLGSEYQFDPQWTLRGGLQYRQTPTPGYSSDSTRMALGAGYRSNDRFSVEMAYTHVLIQQQSLSMDQEPSLTGGLESALGLRGGGAGNSHIFGLGLRYAF